MYECIFISAVFPVPTATQVARVYANACIHVHLMLTVVLPFVRCRPAYHVRTCITRSPWHCALHTCATGDGYLFEEASGSGGLKPWQQGLIAALVVGSVAVVMLLASVVLWRKYKEQQELLHRLAGSMAVNGSKGGNPAQVADIASTNMDYEAGDANPSTNAIKAAMAALILKRGNTGVVQQSGSTGSPAVHTRISDQSRESNNQLAAAANHEIQEMAAARAATNSTTTASTRPSKATTTPSNPSAPISGLHPANPAQPGAGHKEAGTSGSSSDTPHDELKRLIASQQNTTGVDMQQVGGVTHATCSRSQVSFCFQTAQSIRMSMVTLAA